MTPHMYSTRLAPSKRAFDSDGRYSLMKKPMSPTEMTMCRMRGIMAGDWWRRVRWVSRRAKCEGGVGVAVQRRG